MSKNFLKESVKLKTDWFMDAFEIYFYGYTALAPFLLVFMSVCASFLYFFTYDYPFFRMARALVVSKYGINYFGSTKLKRKTHTYLLYGV